MRHLVTGGAGFIGSHLCERLLNSGAEVVAVDNFFTSRPDNVDHLRGHKRFELVRQDVCDPAILWHQVDRVWHLACPASPVHYQKNPARTVETGVLGTLNALKLAQRNRARIFIASTSEIYGDPEVHPQVEGYRGSVDPVGPRACYDEAKRVGETMAAAFSQQYGVEVRIARIFNTYGPRMHPEDGRVVSTFLLQALRREPITLFGAGSQTRSFCYVDDLVDGILRLMYSDCDQPVNLGNPGEFTVNDLATMAHRAACVIHEERGIPRAPLIIREQPLPRDDPRRRRPDITKALSLLGDWAPQVDLASGLLRTARWFADRLG